MPVERGFQLRRDCILPSVQATDSKDPVVIDEARQLIERTVDCEIPGFAIVDEVTEPTSVVKLIHRKHQALVMAALRETVPKIKLDGDFGYPHLYNFGPGTALHMDINGTTLKELIGVLRLHTPSLQATHARLANGRNIAPLGDRQSYSRNMPSLRALGHGYDDLPILSVSDGLAQLDSGNLTVLNYCEPTIYHFDQQPGTSILFRTTSGLGAASVHGFTSTADQVDRPTYISDLTIATAGWEPPAVNF